MLDSDNLHYECKFCGHPIELIDTNTPVKDNCPLCGADLHQQVEEYNRYKKNQRLAVFLENFFDDPIRGLKISEVADFLRCSEEYIRQKIQNDDLQAYEIAEKHIILPSDLLDFLDNRKVKHQ